MTVQQSGEGKFAFVELRTGADAVARPPADFPQVSAARCCAHSAQPPPRSCLPASRRGYGDSGNHPQRNGACRQSDDRRPPVGAPCEAPLFSPLSLCFLSASGRIPHCHARLSLHFQGYVDPSMAAVVAAQAAAAVAAQAQLLGRGGSAAAQAAVASGADAAPSVFLALHNLVTEADLQNNQDYEDVRDACLTPASSPESWLMPRRLFPQIQLDLREEAGKFGTVSELVVPRGSATQEAIGKVRRGYG